MDAGHGVIVAAIATGNNTVAVPVESIYARTNIIIASTTSRGAPQLHHMYIYIYLRYGSDGLKPERTKNLYRRDRSTPNVGVIFGAGLYATGPPRTRKCM